MKNKTFIILGIILIILVIIGLCTSFYDNARVRNNMEPKFTIKTISYNGDKVTYWGLGYKVIRYVGVSPNEPFKSNIGAKFGSWFMKYDLEEKQDKIVTKVAYANWVENDGSLLMDKNCLNIEKFIYSDYPRVPIFKFETKVELDEFINKYKDIFPMNQGYYDEESFESVISNYTEEFFKEHIVTLTYVTTGSGSYRFGITQVLKQNGTLIIRVSQLNNPEVHTDDMAGWALMTEIPREYVKDCTSYDAQIAGDYTGGYIEK